MSTALTVIIGALIVFFIFLVDFKVVEWILRGGLNTFKLRLFIVYLPVVLWWIFGILAFSDIIFGFGSGDLFTWFKRINMLLSGFYGIGFMLYIFMSPSSNVWHWLLSGLMILTSLSPLIHATGVRFNLTPSMPQGIYVMESAAERPERGDLVTFCLESNNPFTELARERGYAGSGSCPLGLKPFLKVLAGLPGDTVEASPDGIILGGSWLAGTARPEYDSQGRPVPPSLLQDGPIPDGQALVISQRHGGSFDSRHFGLVPLDSLTKVTPVLTNYSLSEGET